MAVACLSTPYRAICVLGLSSPYGAPLFQKKHDSARAQLEVNIRKTPNRGDALIFLLHVLEGNHKIRQTGLVCHCVVPSVAAAVAVAAATQGRTVLHTAAGGTLLQRLQIVPKDRRGILPLVNSPTPTTNNHHA